MFTAGGVLKDKTERLFIYSFQAFIVKPRQVCWIGSLFRKAASHTCGQRPPVRQGQEQLWQVWQDPTQYQHSRVEAVDTAFHLCRGGPLLKLELPRIHHGSVEDRCQVGQLAGAEPSFPRPGCPGSPDLS